MYTQTTISTVLPALDYSLNASEIIDLHTAHENRGAAHAFADDAGHITETSHFEFSRAAHRVAHLLRPQRRGPEGQVLAIAGLADVLLYQTIVAGCIKAGIVSPPYELSVEEFPLLGQVYPHLGHETKEDTFVMYPEATTRTPLDNAALYLHSSGSTGFPKCIPETHRTFIHYGALEALSELREVSPRHVVGALPPFHALAFMSQLISPLLAGATACIYGPVSTASEYFASVVPTPENALDNARKTNATGIMAVPSMILEWQSPEHVAYLKTLNMLTYSGGPLASRVGDSLFSQGVNIIPMYGATVYVIFRNIVRLHEIDAGEWAWMRFSSRVNIRWIPQGDGKFECQFLTVPETHQVAVENLPDARGYSTKDLFERHPTKPDLFRIVGRLDDVLIMANGEKTVPGPMEDTIMASPAIMGAVMFGRERNQVGVLIEPNPQYKLDPEDEQQLAKFRNWICGKPMLRAPKGTVIKKVTIALYKEEIEALYDTIEASGNAASNIEPPASWTSRDLEPWLTTHASLLANRDICGGHDLFDQGFDSLNATFLRHRIVAALKNHGEEAAKAASQKIPQNFVYAHPSIEELASAVIGLLLSDGSNGSDVGKKAAIEKMITKYSEGFDEPIVQQGPVSSSSGAVVLLTGSTGGLGSHILEMLLNLLQLSAGRTPLSKRQKEAFVDRALDINLLSSEKLVYLEGDTSKPGLGLPADAWTTVTLRYDSVIIHNAWTLDFNKSLSTFEPHVKGTRNLIDLARQSPNVNVVRFLFTSSIASAQGWDPKVGPFPEELQLDVDVAVGNGYGESKYVSERILAASGLQATSFRIRQVSGATSNGAWSTTDWVPAIVKSSIALGSFPSNPAGTVAWITPEAVAGTIVDAALNTEKPPFAINLVHPRPVTWDALMSSMARAAQRQLIPAVAVGLGSLSTEFSTFKAQALSDAIRSVKSLGTEDAERWIRYWREKGFINIA
ncbi:hypothetical protein B0H17DRAFT_1160660 [Mycena rosella]|uniref:Acetyl-CoA synthetase-like protein n=1 Tax=Mycena rosella TaxID=1033263 RepID=A0AAD7D9R2_MYCRO|nr:hypothetical protein B0H17DRAFT_1160660 [Mycena rosella]